MKTIRIKKRIIDIAITESEKKFLFFIENPSFDT